MRGRALRLACVTGLLLSQAILAKPSQAAWYNFLLPFIGRNNSQSRVQSQTPNQKRALASAAPIGTPVGKRAKSKLKNGRFDGNIYDVYYGYVQVRADVRKGQLVKIDILRYPSDRRTSRIIASRALPVLEQEAIRAQSAKVDLVSGATLTSLGFVKSLADALGHARTG